MSHKQAAFTPRGPDISLFPTCARSLDDQIFTHPNFFFFLPKLPSPIFQHHT